MIALRRRLLWVLMVGLGLALVVTIARHSQDAGPIAGLSTGGWGALAYHLGLVVFVGGAVLVLFRERLSQALEAALFWVLVGFALVFAYTYRGDLRDVGERVMAELMPGRAALRSDHSVEIVRGRAGDFQVAAQVNGTRVVMTSTPAQARSC